MTDEVIGSRKSNKSERAPWPYRIQCPDCGYDSGLKVTTADVVTHNCQEKAERYIRKIEEKLKGEAFTLDEMPEWVQREAYRETHP